MDHQRHVDRFLSQVRLRPLVRSWQGFTLEIHPPTVADLLLFGEESQNRDNEALCIWLFWNSVAVEGARLRETLTEQQVRELDGVLVHQAASQALQLYNEAARPLTPPGA